MRHHIAGTVLVLCAFANGCWKQRHAVHAVPLSASRAESAGRAARQFLDAARQGDSLKLRSLTVGTGSEAFLRWAAASGLLDSTSAGVLVPDSSGWQILDEHVAIGDLVVPTFKIPPQCHPHDEGVRLRFTLRERAGAWRVQRVLLPSC